MKALLGLVLSLLLITLIPGILFGFIWYLGAKKGWKMRNFLSGMLTLLLISISLALWLATRDFWILISGIVVSIVQGIIVLNWSRISPKIVDKIKLWK